jgi:DUF971 family protein
MSAPAPASIKLRRGSRVLELTYPDGTRHALPWEYLRVFSPSAEVRGHGLQEPALVGGKRNVGIERVEPVGQYAVRLVFDDGHNTGLYTTPACIPGTCSRSSSATTRRTGRATCNGWRRRRCRAIRRSSPSPRCSPGNGHHREHALALFSLRKKRAGHEARHGREEKP